MVAALALLGALAISPASAASAPLPDPVVDASPGPLDLDDEMRRWAWQVAPSGTRWARFRRLAQALVSPEGRALRQGEQTLAAQRLFRERSGNCVSFALLLVALARELSLPAVFVRLEADPVVERRGSLRIAAGHVAAALTAPGSLEVFDFGGEGREGERWTVLEDSAVFAIFESNLGAEELTRGEPARAVAHLRRAVAIDPASDVAWTNLGVALRRLGDGRGAEAALRRAVHVAPGSVSAWRNLVLLLEGRLAASAEGAAPEGAGEQRE